MSEFKGTKTQWQLSRGSKTFVYALNEKGTNAFSLNINNDGRTPLEEQQANALLISKAPEMLEMLQHVSDKLNGNGFPSLQFEIDELIKEATEIKLK